MFSIDLEEIKKQSDSHLSFNTISLSLILSLITSGLFLDSFLLSIISNGFTSYTFYLILNFIILTSFFILALPSMQIYYALRKKGFNVHRLQEKVDIELYLKYPFQIALPFVYIAFRTFEFFNHIGLDILSDAIFSIFLMLGFYGTAIEGCNPENGEGNLSDNDKEVDSEYYQGSKKSEISFSFPYLATSSYLELSKEILKTRNDLNLLQSRFKDIESELIHKLSSSIHYFNRGLASFEKLHPSEQKENVHYLFSAIDYINRHIEQAWVEVHQKHKNEVIKMDYILKEKS